MPFYTLYFSLLALLALHFQTASVKFNAMGDSNVNYQKFIYSTSTIIYREMVRDAKRKITSKMNEKGEEEAENENNHKTLHA